MVFARTMRRRAQACDERRLVWAARGACAFVAVMLCLVAARAAVRATGQLVLDVAEGTPQTIQRPPQATIASRRFEIWGSYLSILTDEPTNLRFGFSPDGLDEYIRIHYPDEYIVAFFKQAYPVPYARGEVYGTHNAFLHVLAVAGIFGLIALMGFLAFCARDVLRALAAGRGDLFAHTATAIVVLILGAICFETDVFCRMTASSLLFWLLAGYAMHTLPQDALPQDARQQAAPSQEVRHAA
jgi:O-antigen ligase